jgi:sulfite exporter TauE/SafE
MHEVLWMTALVAGLLGSAHCLGMCGGIATALGATTPGRAARGTLSVLYSCGRITSYGLAGAVAGAFGVATLSALGGSHWAEVLRLCAGGMVVVIGLNIALGYSSRVRWLRAPERWGAALWRRLSPHLGRWLPQAALPRALAVGFLWGWLPCGLVYSALLAAATAGNALSGSITMLAFGAGTLPAMAGVGYLGSRLHLRPPRRGAARIVGACIVLCGLWITAMPIAVLAGAHDQRAHHHAMFVHQGE